MCANNTSKLLANIFLIGFLFICVFFPGDPYHIKMIFLFLCFLMGIPAYIEDIKNKKNRAIYLMGALYPIAVIIVETLVNGRLMSNVAGIYPATIILLVPVIQYYQFSYDKYWIIFLTGIAIAIIGIVIADATGIYKVEYSRIQNAMITLGAGVPSANATTATFYKIFFKSSSLLLIAIAIVFKWRKWWLAIPLYAALYFSGTRANILVGIVLLIFGFVDIWDENGIPKKIKIILAAIAGVLIICLMPTLLNVASGMMNASESQASDSIRSDQLQAFITALSNPKTLIVGDGFGSYISYHGMTVNASEISYLDLLRKIGLVFLGPLMIFILRPLISDKINYHEKLAFLGYLAVCCTNPLLFSSTAYMLYIYLYLKILVDDKERQIG